MQSQPPRFVFDFIRFINSSPSVDRLYALRYSIERNDQEIKELQERLKNLELNRELDLQDYDTLIRKLNADMEVAIDLEKDRFYAKGESPVVVSDVDNARVFEPETD